MRAWYKYLMGRFWLKGSFRIRPGTPGAYLAAALLVALASFIRWALGFVGTPLLPFTAYYPAVLFATYIGGLGAGAFAALLGGGVGWLAFMPPSLFAPGLNLEIPIYALTCALLIWGAESYRRLASHLQNEENLRKLAVDELAHRLKNKIATIQSILSYQLRDQPRLRDDIAARLGALSETDDLIMGAQGRGARLRDILVIELKPYDLSRVSMSGHDIALPPRLALTMALLVHELTTNAAKHGALSSTAGTVSILWSVAGGTLSIEWRESGGPPGAKPAHRGFGLRLLSRALDQFNGGAELSFVETGLVCKLRVGLTEP